MPVSAEIYLEREPINRPLAWSAGLHAAFFGGILLYTAIMGGFSSATWGGSGGGGAISATIVNSIPLPAPATQTQNIVAHESTGLSQSLPETKEEPKPEAIPIPERETKHKPGPQRSNPSKKIEPPKENIAP